MAPAVFNVLTSLAIVDAFCPIATYIQITSLPFWFMIVSVAIAVLPVCLSPMISSLCPRPIGNMESIERRPVSIGTDTDLRSVMPGASHSTGL